MWPVSLRQATARLAADRRDGLYHAPIEEDDMIVVTGGAGFIGSNLVAALEALDVDDIVVCDRFGTGDKWRNLAKRDLAAQVPPDELKTPEFADMALYYRCMAETVLAQQSTFGVSDGKCFLQQRLKDKMDYAWTFAGLAAAKQLVQVP
jgi:hypothetical protein